MHHVDLARAKPAVHMNSPLGYKMKHSPLRDNGNDEVVGSAGEIDMEKDKALRIKLGIPPYDPSGEVASWEGAMTPKNVIRMDSLKTAGGKFSDIRPLELEIMNETWDDAHHGVEGAAPGFREQRLLFLARPSAGGRRPGLAHVVRRWFAL